MENRKMRDFGSIQLYQIVTNIAIVYEKFLQFFSTISLTKMSKTIGKSILFVPLSVCFGLLV